MQGLDWLWPGRFARGKFGLIAGLPDMGKGQIAAFIAAAVTANIELPCDEGHAPQGNVIWFNAEDGMKDTVVPRLVAAGADRKRVKFCTTVRIGGEDKNFSLVTDLRLLRKTIERIGNVLLVIIDPVSAYLGVGKVDGRSATDVRGVLTPMKDMAEELHVAIIGIAHFNKKDDVKSALLRVSDSIAYVAAARHVYAVLDDPEDKERKLFVKAKNNLAPDKKALTAWASKSSGTTQSSASISRRRSSSGTPSMSRSPPTRPCRRPGTRPPSARQRNSCASDWKPDRWTVTTSPKRQSRKASAWRP